MDNGITQRLNSVEKEIRDLKSLQFVGVDALNPQPMQYNFNPTAHASEPIPGYLMWEVNKFKIVFRPDSEFFSGYFIDFYIRWQYNDQQSPQSVSDGFVMKFNPDGSQELIPTRTFLWSRNIPGSMNPSRFDVWLYSWTSGTVEIVYL